MILEDMRKIAIQNNIKYNRTYKKVDLARILNINVEPTVRIKSAAKRPIRITNIDNGDEIVCKTIYKCGQTLNKNPGSISHYVKTGHVLKIEDNSYKLSYV